jgi:hypothetical protein
MPAASAATSEREIRSSAKPGSVATTMNRLRQVGRQQLGFVLVRAVQQRLAFLDLVDDGLVGRGQREIDDVAHGHIGLLAARDALQLAPSPRRPGSGGRGRR